MYLSHHQHFREARRKHKDTILHSMKQQQRKLMIQPMALPSSDELWTSLKTQLLEELQRLARKQQMTLVEMREWMLTQTGDLTREEQTWLKQTRRLVSVMPPLPSPPQGLTSYPSTSTPSNQEVPNPPSTSMPLIIPHLPNPNDLIRQIFPSGQLPIPNSISQYQRVMKPPFVATLMVPLSNPTKSEDVTESPTTSSCRMSHQGS